MPNSNDTSRHLTRRQALGLGASAAGAAALAGWGISRTGGDGPAAADFVLRPRPDSVELGSRTVNTWTYDGRLPGREIRLRQGDPVRIRVDNGLPDPTSIHWHGVRLANGADGVPGMTQDPIEPGGSFLYEFTPRDAGTFFFHPHVGVQLDRGLYAPLIVEPRRETLDYDREAVLMLDDWLDGIAGTPDEELARLRRTGMDMGGMDMEGTDGMDMGGITGTSSPGAGAGRHRSLSGRPPGPGSLVTMANQIEREGGDAGDVDHPLYLINGRPPEDPAQVMVRRGDRLRLRLVNAGSDTIFCVFVEGHPLTVTHTDGMAVEHVETDALTIGMGERYDVLIDADRPGSHRIIAVPLGKRGRAVAMLRYRDAPGSRAADPTGPYRMPRRLLSYEDLVGDDGEPVPGDGRTLRLPLGMTMERYEWTIGGQAFPKADTIALERGVPVQLVMPNDTMMPHPMHLHGHSFRPVRARGAGPLKDTILIPARSTATVAFVPDNPGTWALHCHNIYHAEAGMMRAVEVS